LASFASVGGVGALGFGCAAAAPPHAITVAAKTAT
jgi:hypothetical protein